MAINNVITTEAIKNNKCEIRNPYESIIMSLDTICINSKNTRLSYEKTLSDFMRYICGKELHELKWNDLENITYDRVISYRENLRRLKSPNNRSQDRYSYSTINQKIFSLSSIFKELVRYNGNIPHYNFKLKPLKFDTEEGSYGSLTEDEVEKLLQYCLELPEYQKPLVKALFFEVAYTTAIRVGALLDLKWGNIKQRADIATGTNYNVIRVKDKGNIVEVAISDKLHDRLMQMQESELENKRLKGRKSEQKVFAITRKTLSKCLKEFCEVDNIDEDRKIVLHSLKKSSMDKVYKETGDINATARHGHHKSVEMAYRHYQGKNETLVNSPSLTLFDENARDISELEGLSKEELLKVIENCSGYIVNNIIKTKKEVIG